MTSEPDIPNQPRHTPRIALLTCRHHDHIDYASEGRLMQELVRQGAVVTLIAWTELIDLVARESGEQIQYIDATQSEFDAIVLRTTWDYWDRLEQFRAFLEGCVVEDEAELFNKAKTALANLDKTYLQQLQSAGVPIVPTIFVTKDSEAAAIDQAKSNGWTSIVIKPTVGAAAGGLKKFDRPDTQALDYLTELTRDGGALIQKYLPRVTTEGETSLVYFDGHFSHAVTKVPAEGDFRSQTDFGGDYTLVEPTEAQTHTAELALLAWEKTYNDKPLYARVDLVPGDDGQPLLGEFELIEPELFLDMADGSAEMFATAILARVKNPDAYKETLGHRLMAIGCFAILLFAIIASGVGVATMIRWLFAGP